MMKLVILFVLVAVAAAGPISRLNPLSPTGRIVGGVPTSIDQVPYQASVKSRRLHFCGGSIISEKWILSAAHCTIFKLDWYTVRTGSNFSNDGGTVSSVDRMIIHPKYTYNRLRIPLNDIALLMVRRALTFGVTQSPIGLYNAGQEAVVGAPAVVTGWGALSQGEDFSIVLQTVTVPIISKSSCDSAYSHLGGLPAGHICAAVREGGLDACEGDTGGPLAIDGVLAGIVSWSSGCALPGSPRTYTEVAAFRGWITEISGV